MKKAPLEVNDPFLMQELSQRPPLLFTQDSSPVFLGDIYRGRSAFLICGGPSFASVDSSLLNRPGILTMAVNNAARTFRPNLWTCVDNPQNFILSVWVDPTILKFVPVEHAKTKLFDNDSWEEMDLTPSECPGVFFYMRNLEFDPDVFLEDSTVNWGGAADRGGARSVMLVALRLLYYLGVRDVFLLGADFHMSRRRRYHFAQERSVSAIRSNQYTYAMLAERFRQLIAPFEERGFKVFNCNPRSNLEVFPYVPFRTAIRYALRGMPRNLDTERTEGLYERTVSTRVPKGTKARQEDVNALRFPNLVTDLTAYQNRNPVSETETAAVLVVINRNSENINSWWGKFPGQELSRVIFVDNGMSKRLRKWCRCRGEIMSITGTPWRPEPFAIAQAPADRVIVVEPGWCGNAEALLALVGSAVVLEVGNSTTGSQWPIEFSANVVGSVRKNAFVELMCQHAAEGQEDFTNLINLAAYQSRIPVIPIGQPQ